MCFNKELPNINCRTCEHVDMCNDGIWECGLDNKELSYEDQMAACKMYSVYEIFSDFFNLDSFNNTESAEFVEFFY